MLGNVRGMEKLLPMCAAACELCQQSETFDEDDLYEATTRLRRRPAGIVICSSARNAHSLASWLKCGAGPKAEKLWSEQRGGI